MLLPLLAVVIAVGSAFASQAETNENALVEYGHFKTTIPCDTQILCGSDGIQGCFAPNGQEAKKMVGAGCTVPLFRLN